jgi:translocation and assembly module TamA
MTKVRFLSLLGSVFFVVAAGSLFGLPLALAADPQPYSVDFAGGGDLDAVLAASSQLAGLKDSAPPPPFALIERARADVPRLQTALDSFGYYKNTVTVTIAGLALSDPELADTLSKTTGTVPVKITIDRGPLYHLGTVTIDGAITPGERTALGIRGGDPAVAGSVLDAGASLLSALQEDGYALADVQAPVATADDDKQLIDVTYKVTTGPRATIGAIHFKGLKDVHAAFARKILTIATGDRYRPSRIEAARQALAGLGAFSGVSVEAAHTLSPDGGIDLTFDVQERPRHAVTLAGTYSTDLGISLSASWSHRNLFGNGEQLNLTAAGTGLGTASAGLGYNLSAQFIKPLFLESNQLLELDVTGVKQQLDAYDQTANGLTALVRRKFSPLWSGSAGVSLLYDQVAQEGSSRLYQLVGLPVIATYDSTGITDILHDPVRGARLSFAVTPTQSFGDSNLTFALLQASGSTYFDLSGDGRSVLALRALLGNILGGSNLELPPDQRLYAGGSATVRGFAYQSIGPQFADGNPVGAKSVDAATVEMRQRFLDNWGAVAFIDAGQASAGGAPLSGALHVGAGLGLRYYTPIGAVRADIAVPVNRISGSDAFEVYIGLGQAF